MVIYSKGLSVVLISILYNINDLNLNLNRFPHLLLCYKRTNGMLLSPVCM